MIVKYLKLDHKKSQIKQLEFIKNEENKVLVYHGYKQEKRNIDLLVKYVERKPNGRIDKAATLEFCLKRLQFLNGYRD